MTDLQGLLGATQDDTYEKLDKKVLKLYYVEEFYGSLVICTVIIALAVQLIRKKQFLRFEWTIIICMLLKYTL